MCSCDFVPSAQRVCNTNWYKGWNELKRHNAVKVGVDKDGGFIYAGRAYYEGDLLPAKIIPSRHSAFVSWGGREHEIDEYEVLYNVDVGWATCSGGNVPPEAMCVGQTSDGEGLYMGRVVHDGTLTPGKIHPSYECLFISYAGEEFRYSEYETMVLK